MSSSIPVSLHPIVICEDRYSGVYCNGAWWAVAQADQKLEGLSRIAWLWEHGPGSGDVDAAVFWQQPPPWIAAGNTPDEALSRLLSNPGSDGDTWSPLPREDDPRYRPSLFDSSRAPDD